jgi:hypothetical protein
MTPSAVFTALLQRLFPPDEATTCGIFCPLKTGAALTAPAGAFWVGGFDLVHFFRELSVAGWSLTRRVSSKHHAAENGHRWLRRHNRPPCGQFFDERASTE